MDRRNSMGARLAMLIGLAALVTSACGGSDGPVPQTGAERPADGSPEATAPTPLDGDYYSGSSVLRLEAGSWLYVTSRFRWTGAATVSPDELVISGEASCPDAGTYAWSETSGVMTLELVEDPCAGRGVLLAKAWESIAALDDATAEGTIVTLPDLRFAAFWGRVDVSDRASTEIEVSVREGYDTAGWLFAPTILEGTPGQELELTVRNPREPGVFVTPHNFTQDEQGISVDVQPGDTALVNLVFPESGSLVFYCRFHVDEGQAGALVVV